MEYPEEYESPLLVEVLRYLAWLGMSLPLLVQILFIPVKLPWTAMAWAVLSGLIWLILCLAISSALDALWRIEFNSRKSN